MTTVETLAICLVCAGGTASAARFAGPPAPPTQEGAAPGPTCPAGRWALTLTPAEGDCRLEQKLGTSSPLQLTVEKGEGAAARRTSAWTIGDRDADFKIVEDSGTKGLHGNAAFLNNVCVLNFESHTVKDGPPAVATLVRVVAMAQPDGTVVGGGTYEGVTSKSGVGCSQGFGVAGHFAPRAAAGPPAPPPESPPPTESLPPPAPESPPQQLPVFP